MVTFFFVCDSIATHLSLQLDGEFFCVEIVEMVHLSMRLDVCEFFCVG